MPKVATIRNYLPSRLLRRLRNFGEGCGSTARSTSWAILTTASAGARCGKCSNGVNVNALNPGAKADLAESCAVHSINMSIAPA
jgi:hypothetical protein